jgi:hypothetical protein
LRELGRRQRGRIQGQAEKRKDGRQRGKDGRQRRKEGCKKEKKLWEEVMRVNGRRMGEDRKEEKN